MSNFPRILWYLTHAMRRLRWDRQKLKAYQEKRLRLIVRNAYETVPFYHEIFDRAGVKPSDIRFLGDLSRLPVIEKDVIRREDHVRLISTDADPHRLKVVRTTGTTGKPFQVFINQGESDWRKATFMRANISCGQRPGDRWVLVTLPSHESDTTGLQRRIGIFAQTIISLYSDVSEQLSLVEKARPDVLDGYSMWLHSLAKEAQSRGIEKIRPRIMFGSAELIDNASARFMEKVFQAPFYDQFGCSEVDRTAWQCPEKTGYHMDIDSVITQFVDDAGQEVSPGENGKVVYTSLFNFSMPLIRYAVGDVGVPSDEVCPCGRMLPLMKLVEGRTDSMLRLPNGRLLSPVTVIGAMDNFDLFNQIDEYRVVQKRVDLLRFYIRKKAGGINENLLRDRLVTYFNNSLRINPNEVGIEVEFVDNIPMIGGKHRAIVSEVTA